MTVNIKLIFLLVDFIYIKKIFHDVHNTVCGCDSSSNSKLVYFRFGTVVENLTNSVFKCILGHFLYIFERVGLPMVQINSADLLAVEINFVDLLVVQINFVNLLMVQIKPVNLLVVQINSESVGCPVFPINSVDLFVVQTNSVGFLWFKSTLRLVL